MVLQLSWGIQTGAVRGDQERHDDLQDGLDTSGPSDLVVQSNFNDVDLGNVPTILEATAANQETGGLGQVQADESCERPAKLLKGFRHRWRVQSQARSLDEGSGSHLGDWDEWQTGRIDDNSIQEDELQVTPQVLENIQQTAQLAALQTVRQRNIKLPWETGPLAALFVSQDVISVDAKMDMPRVGLVDTLNPSQTLREEKVVQQSSISPFAMQRLRQARVAVSSDNSRDRALNQIKVILLTDLQATELGRAMTNLAGALDEKADLITLHHVSIPQRRWYTRMFVISVTATMQLRVLLTFWNRCGFSKFI